MAETADARWANRSSLLAVLLAGGRHSRAGLTQQTGLSAATVSRVVEGLLDEGLVREGAVLQTGRRGRQGVVIEVAAERGVAVGVDLGGTTCRFLATDLLGRSPRYHEEPTPRHLAADHLADWLAERVRALYAAAGAAAARPDAAAPDVLRAGVIGLPGAVAADGLGVRGATNLPQIEGDLFTRRLRRALEGTVAFGNDADLALEGELRHGAARTAETAVMFTVGAGFGAGVAVDRHIRGGPTGLVGEFGFLPVDSDDHTVEELVGAEGLMRAAREAGLDVATAADVFTATAPAARAVVERFERALGIALTAVTIAYEPELVVLGGRVSASIDTAMTTRLRERVRRRLPACPELVHSELADLAGALGAVSRGLTALRGRFDVAPDAAAAVRADLDLAALLTPRSH
ncbi:ROK family transcriptional regulator [Embleya hyalina]|uniref:Sugar kinase n=1 Tax=Embleya hyalina TaxID=516124 RepID=A0A401YJ58_9ACTN|nr:ROK family protein [Embleya hyalina]GCD94643.1 sugar kinase [Embleya hyalina]